MADIKAARERCRRYRARQRERHPVAFYSVPLDCSTLDMLVRLGWLNESEITDKAQVAAAIAEILKDAAKK